LSDSYQAKMAAIIATVQAYMDQEMHDVAAEHESASRAWKLAAWMPMTHAQYLRRIPWKARDLAARG